MRKSKLADKIISSSLYENGVIKNLEQISYANINGQRQEANIYQPEGVQMLGQMGREKPLSAITKEMIKDYQEKELEPKFFKDGEPMLYKEAIYEPLLKTPIDIDDIKNDLRILYNNKIATSQAIKDAEDNIKALDDYYKAFMRDIRIFGMNIERKQEKEKLERDKVKLKMEYDELRNDYDKTDLEMKSLFQLAKDIKKSNALIPQENKEEIMKYEQSLKQQNQNRLNLQQQPQESDLEYYKRLKEVEQTKYDPILFKQYSINKNIKELKSKMENLFKEPSFIEQVIKYLPDETKFIINKNFDYIKSSFIKNYGYNPSISVNMASDLLKQEINKISSASSLLKGAIKRKARKEEYIQELTPIREATENLQRFARGNLAKEEERKLRQQAMMEEEQAMMEEEASKNIQRVIRGNLGRREAKSERTKERFLKSLEKETEEKKKAIEKLSSVFKRNIDKDKIKDKEKVKKTLEKYSNIEPSFDLSVRTRPNIPYSSSSLLDEKRKEREQKALERYLNIEPSYLLSSKEPEIPSIQTPTKEEKEYLKNIILEKVKRKKAMEGLKEEKASRKIQSVYRKYLAKEEEEEPLSPSYDPSLLSGATTTPTQFRELKREQEEAKLRKMRRDIGIERGSRLIKEYKELIDTLTPSQRNEFLKSYKLEAHTNKFNLRKLKEFIKKQGTQGSGILIKPKRAQKGKKDITEGKKNRLRLIVAQMKAGNTNPRLIPELNNLYKELYNIDNAYSLLSSSNSKGLL